MRLKEFLKDKLYVIVAFIISYFLILLVLVAFKLPSVSIVVVSLILLLFLFFALLGEFFRKRSFYDSLKNNIEILDKAYLVLETIEEPEFYEGKQIVQAMYKINKSYLENVSYLDSALKEFKDYIEMWIHEVKLPLSSLTLIMHNSKAKIADTTLEQIKRLENYVDQVLYYVRSENAEIDYLINKVNINKVINRVLVKNKNDLLLNKIDVEVLNAEVFLYTDSKWLEFIINQIINNSIKYKKDGVKSWIKINVLEGYDVVSIEIIDNGIGISAQDLPKVFDYTFTGTNGRDSNKSTGMGLYISKKLIDKLGHKINITSTLNEYTKVTITIAKNKYYDVVK